jgi:hypothetical protein
LDLLIRYDVVNKLWENCPYNNAVEHVGEGRCVGAWFRDVETLFNQKGEWYIKKDRAPALLNCGKRGATAPCREMKLLMSAVVGGMKNNGVFKWAYKPKWAGSKKVN